jgi:hypothetical protein
MLNTCQLTSPIYYKYVKLDRYLACQRALKDRNCGPWLSAPRGQQTAKPNMKIFRQLHLHTMQLTRPSKDFVLRCVACSDGCTPGPRGPPPPPACWGRGGAPALLPAGHPPVAPRRPGSRTGS